MTALKRPFLVALLCFLFALAAAQEPAGARAAQEEAPEPLVVEQVAEVELAEEPETDTGGPAAAEEKEVGTANTEVELAEEPETDTGGPAAAEEKEVTANTKGQEAVEEKSEKKSEETGESAPPVITRRLSVATGPQDNWAAKYKEDNPNWPFEATETPPSEAFLQAERRLLEAYVPVEPPFMCRQWRESSFRDPQYSNGNSAPNGCCYCVCQECSGPPIDGRPRCVCPACDDCNGVVW